MKASTIIAMIAMGLVLTSSGVLYPIRGNVDELEQTVATLEDQRLTEQGVRDQVRLTHERVAAMRELRNERKASLCPDTPEALQAVETMVLENVLESGLVSVRMDSGATDRSGRYPFRAIELVVEGRAASLQSFLIALESMPWVTRVLKLSIEQGDKTRRINLRIAVMLEAHP